MLDLAVVGPVMGENIALDTTTVFDDLAFRGDGATGDGDRGNDTRGRRWGRIDIHGRPAVVLVIVPAASQVVVAGRADTEDVVQALVVICRVAGGSAGEFADRAEGVVAGETFGVTDDLVVGGDRSALLIADERGGRVRGVTDLQQVFGREEQVAAVGECVLHCRVILEVAVAGVVLAKVALILAEGDNVGGLAEGIDRDGPGGFERHALGSVVADVVAEFLRLPILRCLGDHVHHTTGRSASVDGGVGAFDNFHPIDIARAVTAEAEKAVAQLVGGLKTAEVKTTADVESGKAADLNNVIGELEDTEVFEEFAREHVHGVGQIDDLGRDARAGHRLGGCVAAVGVGADGEFRESQHFAIGFGGRCGCRGCRLGAEGGAEREGGEQGREGAEWVGRCRVHWLLGRCRVHWLVGWVWVRGGVR